MPEQIQSRHTTKNHILNSLPYEEYELLRPHLEQVNLALGQILYRPDELIEYVYFPDNSMISVIATVPDGQCAEVGVVGWEGASGIDVLMGVDSTSQETIVQLADGASRINTKAIRELFNQSEVLRGVLLRYIHAMMMQISQTALCNRLHPLEQRLSRWLLMCRDRATTDELTLTQDFLSIMLGVNRPSLTLAALALQSGGFIKYSRGVIVILDHEGLEDFTCACYSVVKQEYAQMHNQMDKKIHNHS